MPILPNFVYYGKTRKKKGFSDYHTTDDSRDKACSLDRNVAECAKVYTPLRVKNKQKKLIQEMIKIIGHKDAFQSKTYHPHNT